jgi:CobQ/CobB/MinD/ParA family nucleotide binding protein
MSEINENANLSKGTAIHVSLQGKGGVGKSIIASILAQYFIARGRRIQCIDTDPVNHTLSQYKALPVKLLKLLNGTRINERKFDALLDTFLKEETTFVVDNGASTFIPLWNFMLESHALPTLREAQIPVYIHTVITGGHGLSDTILGFQHLAETTEDRKLVIWFNEYFGPIEWGDKSFQESDIFKLNEPRILGTVTIPKRTPDTFGRDFEEMIALRQTFGEALLWGGSSIMTKQRLKMIRDDLFDQLDKLEFTSSVPAMASDTR